MRNLLSRTRENVRDVVSMETQEPLELVVTLLALVIIFAGISIVPIFLGFHWYGYALTGAAFVTGFVMLKLAT